MRAPSARNASTRPPIGRSCIRGAPESRYSPPASARTAVSGRKAVPALPRRRSADLTGNPPTPCTTAESFACRSILTPRFPSASSMTWVSSASRRSFTRVSPRESAASRSTRLEMLFDPGILTVPCARAIGLRSRNLTCPSASARAPPAPRRSFSPPWKRRGGARSATGWSTVLLAATPPRRVRRHPSSKEKRKIQALPSLRVPLPSLRVLQPALARSPRPGGLFPLLGKGGVARAARRGGRPSFSRRHHPAAFGGTPPRKRSAKSRHCPHCASRCPHCESFSQRSRAPRAPAVFFPSLEKEGWRAQRDGVVDRPSRGDTTPPPSAAPLLERGGENPGAALIARPAALIASPSASARALPAPRRSFSPPWKRRGGARSATGWSTALLAATPPRRLRRHPSSKEEGKIQALPSLRVPLPSLRILQPAVARSARSREKRMERPAVAALEHPLHALELPAVAGELGEQRLAVGEADIAPHLGVAGGDAGEIAESPRRVGKELLRVLRARDLVDERVREHVRQVADGRQHRIVLPGPQLRDARSAALPRGAHQGERSRRGSFQRREHHPAPAVEPGERGFGAALLGARDRMPRNETRKRGFQPAPGARGNREARRPSRVR